LVRVEDCTPEERSIVERDLILPVRGEETGFERGSVFFVGTATVIIRYGGFTILTDPNFLHAGDHVHLGYGLRSRRLTNPAVEIEDLPPLDLVVLSHLHGDHFDRVAEEKLDKTLPIITTPHAARYLEGKGFRPLEGLKTWESMTVRKDNARLRVTAMPGTHAPGPLRKVLPPVMGSMLEFGEAEGGTRLRLYISGDTLVHNRLREIPRRYPEIDLALLHLGGTRVLGILVTMDAEQGVEALRIIDPRTAVPIHYNDYGVFKSPLEDFEKAVAEAGLEDRVRYLAHGETYEFEVP
jgi:L-ascorbate metabolism protein UlaG (beta-lactamase superfamily)